MVNLQYSKETLVKLFALLCNRCSYPDCKHQVFDTEKNFLCQICHIEAKSPNGPRHNKQQSKSERDGYDNLIVLCRDHHDEIDKNDNKYDVKKIKQMKTDHEKNCSQRFTLTDEYLEKIHLKIEQDQQNIQFGNGTQYNILGNLTINQGPTREEIQNIVLELVKENVIKMIQQAETQKILNAKKFSDEIFSQGTKFLDDKEWQKLADPDIQSALFEAAKSSARRDDEQLRKILSTFVIKRIKHDGDDLRRVVLNEAITTVPKLTPNEMKIIALCFLLKETVFLDVVNLQSFSNLLSKKIQPFLDFKDSTTEFQHLEYAGVGKISFGSNDIVAILKEAYSRVFVNRGLTAQEIQDMGFTDTTKNYFVIYDNQLNGYIFIALNKELLKRTLQDMHYSEDFIQKSLEKYERILMNPNEIHNVINQNETGQKLIRIFENTPLKSLLLTSVGKAIAMIYCEQILGEKFDFDTWIN